MRKHGLFLLSLLALLVLCAAYFTAAHVSARGGEGAPLFSIRRHDPYGTAAMFELLEKRGTQVGSLERSLVPADFSGTLVRVGASDYGPALQTKATLEWIKKGGRLVVFAPAADDLLRAAFPLPMAKKEAGIKPEAEADPKSKAPHPAKAQGKESSASATPAVPPHPLSALIDTPDKAWEKTLLVGMAHGEHPDRLLPPAAHLQWEKQAGSLLNLRALPASATLAAPLPLPEAFPHWTVLARTAEHQAPGAKTAPRMIPVIGQLEMGKGQLVLVSDPLPISNFGLSHADNLPLVLGLLEQHGPVLFDEYSHGLGSSDRLMALIMRFGLLPILFQAVFTALLFVWSTAGSPRPKMPVRLVRPRPASDQVLALGHLLEQALHSADLLARVPHLVRRRFINALGIPPESLERTLHKQAAGPRALDLMRRADALAHNLPASSVSHAKAEALAILCDSHDLAKELAHATH